MTAAASVSASWLLDNLKQPDVRVFDASWHLPAAGRNGAEEFQAGHVPGARFFDIDAIVDPASGLPHTLPDAATFEAHLQAHGVNTGEHLVFYDNSALRSAARGWWMMRSMGHDRVSVLDGGLNAWRMAGGAVRMGAADAVRPGDFAANFQPHLVRAKDDILDIIETGSSTIIDARSPGRFRAEEPEPRPDARGGHMPGAANVPYASLYGDDGHLKPDSELAAAFEAAGVDTDAPIVTSCGSGVTACNLAHALYRLGNSEVAVYDGSWSEWGRLEGAPIETGPNQQKK